MADRWRQQRYSELASNGDWAAVSEHVFTSCLRHANISISLETSCQTFLIFTNKTFCFQSIYIVAAFRGMHVSPAKHSYAWLSRKFDYWTDRHTHTQTDAGQSDPYVPLCFAGWLLKSDEEAHNAGQISDPYVRGSVTIGQTDTRTHRQTPDKVIPMWPLTFKINRVHPLTMVNMFAKSDKEIHNG